MGSILARVRCPACESLDDKVVDSRASEDGGAIRRRRECLACSRRFTTYERLEEGAVSLVVRKRSGHSEPFDRAKIVAGLVSAAKNRPLTTSQLEELAMDVEEFLRLGGPVVPSEAVGLAVLERLRDRDSVTYLRFASVYKDFEDVADFQREAAVLGKETAPKTRRPVSDPAF